MLFKYSISAGPQCPGARPLAPRPFGVRPPAPGSPPPGERMGGPVPDAASRTGSPPPGSAPARAYASFGVRATMPVASIPTMRSSYTHVGVAMPESSSDPTTPPADMSISAFFLSGSTPCWTKSTESP